MSKSKSFDAGQTLGEAVADTFGQLVAWPVEAWGVMLSIGVLHSIAPTVVGTLPYLSGKTFGLPVFLGLATFASQLKNTINVKRILRGVR